MAMLKSLTQMVMSIKLKVSMQNNFIVRAEFKGQNSTCKTWLNCG